MIVVRHGDALDVLRDLPPHSAHALVTDPPAGVSFMGKDWDSDRGGRAQWVAWLASILREARRVLTPGAHALVWALPRTSHWTATALEDAGFEVRDVLVHLFGTGFPKSLDVSKAIDKAAGADREVVGVYASPEGTSGRSDGSGVRVGAKGIGGLNSITAPATPEAQRWAGYGTALKPGSEHWILARVPLDGTVAQTVLAHGTGALNVDGCRIEGPPSGLKPYTRAEGNRIYNGTKSKPDTMLGVGAEVTFEDHPKGRWPANVILSPEAAAELDAQSGELRPGAIPARRSGLGYHGGAAGFDTGARVVLDGGGASRFFYVAKPSRSERGESNTHPTVKGIELMRWLVRLVTPPGGTVLDPFGGSGTTALACVDERVGCVLIEQDASHVEIIRARVAEYAPLADAALPPPPPGAPVVKPRPAQLQLF